MKIITAKNGMEQALHILHSGGVIAHATETCYGFACDLTNPDAIRKLFAIKHRPADQPVSALFPDVDEAKKWVEWNDEASALAKNHLPGPLTLILPLRKEMIGKIFLTSSQAHKPVTRKPETSKQSLGVRISSHSVAMELAKRFGNPLSTTSANIHGRPNPYSTDEIEYQFSTTNSPLSIRLLPDLILDSGTLPFVPPSTVIDLTGNSGNIVRTGIVKP
ncbi:MAG: L-threonylcarbamoyladenylate synthase [Patescibacteria group bacterium]